jgi:cytochrome b6-f complex iron-sulfur subunit
MTRRELIQKVLVGGTTLILVPAILQSCTKVNDLPGNNNNNSNKVTLDLTNPSYSVLATAGGSLVYMGVIVANTGTSFIALASACTHSGCTVRYNHGGNNFPCDCHGSLFSSSGSVLNGPATTALKSYPISRSGDILTITL